MKSEKLLTNKIWYVTIYWSLVILPLKYFNFLSTAIMLNTHKCLRAIFTLTGAFVSVFMSGIGVDSTYANSDYVCSTYSTSCSCTWETNWRADGTKHCVGTRVNTTRYGNTRAGCPSSSAAYGSVGFGYNGGFIWGDVNTTASCDLVAGDNVAPILNAQGQPVTTSQVIGYKKSGCVGDTCYFRAQDCKTTAGVFGCEGNLYTLEELQALSLNTQAPFQMGNLFKGVVETASARTSKVYTCTGSACLAATNTKKTIGYSFTPSCSDSQMVFNTDANRYGDSGIGSWDASPRTILVGHTYTFSCIDKANNKTTCTAYGNGTPTQCSSAIKAAGQLNVVNAVSCYFANGSICVPDSTPPQARIEYDPVSCTSQNVTVTNRCVSDPGGSGCRAGAEGAPTLLVSSNQAGTLGVADAAGNVMNLAYNVSWIDKIAPANVSMVINSQLAGANVATISATDAGAPGCALDGINYVLHITGAATKDVTGILPKDGTPLVVDLGLQKSGNYTFVLTVSDEAGNVGQSASASATIYPGVVDASKSTLARQEQSGSRYADGAETYTYKLTLQDTYGNPVYSKSALSIEQDYEASGVKTIKSDMTNPSSPEGALSVLSNHNTSTKTDTNGNLLFTVHANAPGVFSEKFRISISKWNGNYEDTGSSYSLSISSGEENSFRKPFIAALAINNPAYNHMPVGTTVPMKLNVTKKASGGAFSSKTVNDFG